MKCYYCGGPVTEAEFKERYEEFVAQGIVPMMMPSHKACREGNQLDVKSVKLADASDEMIEKMRNE